MQRLLGDRLFTRRQVCPGDGTSSTPESEKHYHGPEWVCASPTLAAVTWQENGMALQIVEHMRICIQSQ